MKKADETTRIGYGKSFAVYDPQLPFLVKIPDLLRTPESPFEEARKAAIEIYKNLGQAPVLCLSGGLDSECMALAFLESKIPFQVATLAFSNGLNCHDIEHATSFCKENKLVQNLFELDIVNFFKSGEFKTYVDLYFCHTPELAAQLWFLDQIKSPFIWAGEPFRVFSESKPPAIQSISEFEAVFFRYSERQKQNSVPNFHFYSAELAWSFFKLSLNSRDVNYPNDHTPEYYLQKLEFYRNAGFPVRTVSERTIKLHGFERVEDYFDKELAAIPGASYNSVYRRPVLEKFPLANNTLVQFAKNDRYAAEIFYE